jgi:hypothetical protein
MTLSRLMKKSPVSPSGVEGLLLLLRIPKFKKGLDCARPERCLKSCSEHASSSVSEGERAVE